MAWVPGPSKFTKSLTITKIGPILAQGLLVPPTQLEGGRILVSAHWPGRGSGKAPYSCTVTDRLRQPVAAASSDGRYSRNFGDTRGRNTPAAAPASFCCCGLFLVLFSVKCFYSEVQSPMFFNLNPFLILCSLVERHSEVV
jgi:hypothetical protein